ncbi:hypothetical protein PGTUg99_021588 [Puccinia graminis f. sp. tritici]|uniref:Uncharacterized protein n=1 Tax=Puccinia graminis f. sp. tritici TaxID=56615 RepID=A0A5B0QL60_PUCGR|nr:hypothetical protein PGTUg99_021588 [Puccinia graminis f. sp. tritici]
MFLLLRLPRHVAGGLRPIQITPVRSWERCYCAAVFEDYRSVAGGYGVRKGKWLARGSADLALADAPPQRTKSTNTNRDKGNTEPTRVGLERNDYSRRRHQSLYGPLLSFPPFRTPSSAPRRRPFLTDNLPPVKRNSPTFHSDFYPP